MQPSKIPLGEPVRWTGLGCCHSKEELEGPGEKSQLQKEPHAERQEQTTKTSGEDLTNGEGQHVTGEWHLHIIEIGLVAGLSVVYWQEAYIIPA